MPPATEPPLQVVRRGGAGPRKPDCAIHSDSAKSTEMVPCPTYDEIVSRMGKLLEGVERRRTQAKIQEVCISYVLGRCAWFSSCRRIHPFNKSPFLEMYLEWYRAYRQANSAQIQLASSAEYTESAQPVNCIVLEDADQPMVNLPRLKSPRYFAGDFVSPEPCFSGAPLDDDFPSWDSETGCWITPSDSHSWTCGSSSVSSRANSPSWDPQDMDQRKGFTDSWIGGGNPSDIDSSECSTLYSKASHSRELHRVSQFPSIQALEKCERWTNSLRSNQIGSSIAGLEERHHRPRYPDRCKLWLRGQCNWGYACKFVHDDLENTEEPKQEPIGPTWVTTVHDYVKVKLTAGFHVENAATGFETSILLVHGIPNQMTTDELLHLLQPFGTVSDIRMVEKSSLPTKTARVFFSKPEDARSALSGLKSALPTLSPEMPVSASNRNVIFKDGMVVVEWHPPGKTWYAGYSSAADARSAIAQCYAMAWENPVDAQIHKGLPAVGVVTVRFRALPADFNEDGMKLFGTPTSVMWERPKYTNLARAIGVIRGILEEFGPVLSFRVCPPSSRDFKHKAYAQFSSPAAADAARDRLHGICPTFTGKTKIFAYHDKSLEYRIAPETFARTASGVDALKQHIWERYRYNASLFISKHSPVIIELHARELKILGQIKLEFEKVLSGEIVKHDGKVVWDEFFAQSTGIEYLQVLQNQSGGVTIRNEMNTRKIRLFGSRTSRGFIARQIIAKVMELRAQQISFIPLGGRFIADFMSREFRELQHELGPENVVLDLYNRRISVRGGEAIHRKARDFVHKRANTINTPWLWTLLVPCLPLKLLTICDN
ncbi:hypothetical protein APHAL10511_002513 [Amanita phalloides]|nr:hypothetical protein APHAL10511_002513 [Amanita phalloides]